MHDYSFITNHKGSVVIEKSFASKTTNKHLHFTNEIDMRRVNIIVTVGCDGSILWAHRHYKYGNIPPIISFSMVIVRLIL